MAVLEVFFSFLFIFSLYKLPQYTTARARDEVCSASTCSDFDIRFPFRLRQRQYNFCGYPGFDLTCNNRSQTIINLPNAGRFAVTAISYIKQEIWINDPDDCPPKRFLNFSLLNSPFNSSNLQNYTYYNCSTNYAWLIPGYMSIPCLGGHNYSVLVRQTWMSDAPPSSCVEVATVSAPVSEWLGLTDLSGDIRLKWDNPSCGSCERKGGLCGLKSFGSLDTKCYNLPHSGSGLPRSARYGIIIGVGIPGLICIIGLGCYICGRLRVYVRPHNPNIDFATSLTPQPGVIVLGLDKPTIESYPKTVLGESKRLPKPNDDGTCAICLCEYQAKETLRTIPECNHYFHAQCIDEWLRLNATCPLCRNTPDGSSHVTPSSLSSLSLSPASSSTSS